MSDDLGKKFIRGGTHAFDPGGRAHWAKPRCKVCELFEEHEIHAVRKPSEEMTIQSTEHGSFRVRYDPEPADLFTFIMTIPGPFGMPVSVHSKIPRAKAHLIAGYIQRKLEI